MNTIETILLFDFQFELKRPTGLNLNWIDWLDLLWMNFNEFDLERGPKRLKSKPILFDWLNFLRMNLILKDGLRSLISIKNNSFFCFQKWTARAWCACCLLLEIWYLRAWVFRVPSRMTEFFSKLCCRRLRSWIGKSSVLFIGKQPPFPY